MDTQASADPTDHLAQVAALCSLSDAEVCAIGLSETDVPHLTALIAHEGLTGWVLRRLTDAHRTDPPAEALRRAIKPQAMATVVHNTQIIGVRAKVAAQMRNVGAEPIMLKGAALADSLYLGPSGAPDYSLRFLSDIDILVASEAELRKALRVLKPDISDTEVETAVRESAVRHHDSQHLMVDNVSVEIHTSLADPLEGLEPNEEIRNLCTTHQGVGAAKESLVTLRPDAMLYHLALHMIHHRTYSGIALKWIIDIAALLSREADPVALIERAKALNPNASKQIGEACSLAMSLTSDTCRYALSQAGISVTPINNQSLSNPQSHLGQMSSMLGSKMLKLWHLIRRAKGLGAKWRVLCQAVGHMAAAGKEQHPNSPTVVAFVLRLIGK